MYLDIFVIIEIQVQLYERMCLLTQIGKHPCMALVVEPTKKCAKIIQAIFLLR